MPRHRPTKKPATTPQSRPPAGLWTEAVRAVIRTVVPLVVSPALMAALDALRSWV